MSRSNVSGRGEFIFWVTLLVFGIFYYTYFTKGFSLGWCLGSFGSGLLNFMVD